MTRRGELLASPTRERGLPRPLLGVLLGYAKMSCYRLLLETDFADRPLARPFLDGYFPAVLRERLRIKQPTITFSTTDRSPAAV